jgi:hypothetical protein
MKQEGDKHTNEAISPPRGIDEQIDINTAKTSTDFEKIKEAVHKLVPVGRECDFYSEPE